MECEPRFFNPNEYIVTTTNTKVSRHNTILGSDNIQVGTNSIFKENIMLRADLASIKMGNFVILCENVIIRPTCKRVKGGLKFFHLSIGNNVLFEKRAIVQALKIGSNVTIGKNCVICNNVSISDNVQILDDSIVPPDAVLAPFSVYGGKPAVFLGELCEQASNILKCKAQDYYRSFIPHPSFDKQKHRHQQSNKPKDTKE